jgi:hypothetical protein
MNVGDRVKTNERWSIRWIAPDTTGTVIRIDPTGSPKNPNRTHVVKLDKNIGPFNRVWFDPDDLDVI